MLEIAIRTSGHNKNMLTNLKKVKQGCKAVFCLKNINEEKSFHYPGCGQVCDIYINTGKLSWKQ